MESTSIRRAIAAPMALLFAAVSAFATTATPTPIPVETATAGPTPSLTFYGALSNFDVFNDTGQECHGFEIELDDVTSQDVTFTFGSPYQRYGNPTVVDFAGGVYVRYESPYDAANQVFTQATPLAPSVITPTDGHACWTGGSPTYPTSGCEHFGVGLARNPTATVYRWLIADPANPGTLQPSGTKVSIPAPLWNVSPAPPGAPNQQPVVAAVIQPEPPEPGFEFGDAFWVKVFKTEAPDAVELHHLVTDDPGVPQDQSETEVDWTLLQSSTKMQRQLENEAQVGEGNESVTRRYEFYRYTGAYDPETHEALPLSDSAPAEGELGNYIGAQMAALNLTPPGPTPTETPAATPTPTAAACAGDCDGNHEVIVSELVTLVKIALAQEPVSACLAGDGNSDGAVTVAEIVAAVMRTLNGCPG